MLLVLLKSPHWVEFNEGDLEISPKVQELWILCSFLSLNIQLNYKR
jgi:hypothetical protein